MAARSLAEPQGRPNKFTDVGVVGRKTGLMVKDTGRRDSAGLEDMDAFFSPTIEKSAKKGVLLSPAKVRTTFQSTIASESSIASVELGLTIDSRNSKDILASRKSLLAQHRTPQKTFLKSPAVRVQTPKQSQLNSPARVKRLLSFMELDNDLEDQNVQDEEAEPVESPSEVVKPVKRGLTQQSRPKVPVFEGPEHEEEEEEDMAVEENVGGYEDDGGYGGFGDDSYGQYEDEQQEDVGGEVDEEEELDEEERYEKPAAPPVKRSKTTLKASKPAKKPAGPHSKPQVEEHYYEEEYDDEEEEEEDIYGQPPSPQPQPRSRIQKSKKSAKSSRSRKQSGQPPSSQPTKRARTTSTAPRSPKIIERREVPYAADISTMDGDVRRSTRIKVPPLAHWRNERIVYELESRRQSGPALPKIKEIVRIDTPPQLSRHNNSRARSIGPQSRKRKADSDSESDNESDAGEVYATIKSFEDNVTIEDYRIAVAKSAIHPQPLQGSKVHFEKLFQDGTYVACGIMDIVVGGQKGVKPTRHSFMNFAVMTGKVEVKVNRTAFIIGKGGVFVVPRGNVYSIKNVGNKDCRLFFSQAVEDGGRGAEEQKAEDGEEE